VIERESLKALAEEGCGCGELSNRLESGEIDGFLLKPMNCPHHAKIFASEPHSYRDMPVRLAEFGTVYRWEQSGELNGMTRVRGFTQDDAHLFVREDQVAEEVLGCLSLVKIIFATLGMNEYRVRVGLRTRAADDGSGLEVIDVTQEGSAAKAGIEKGDKIVKWNKKEMKDREAFVAELRLHEPEETVQCVVVRNGEEKTVYVKLEPARSGQ
jgi:threonyl-tRNA synthetase